jgi:hypothetical protein
MRNGNCRTGACFSRALESGPVRRLPRWYLGAPGFGLRRRSMPAFGSTDGVLVAVHGSTDGDLAGADGSTDRVLVAADGLTDGDQVAAGGSTGGR